MNSASIQVGRFYKVPRGFELPFAGRWLKVTKIMPGGVDLCAAGGNRIRFPNALADLLAQNADDVRVTTPKGFL